MTDDVNEVSEFIESLDREADQEREISEDRGSFFETAPSSEIIRRRAREYEDVEKHIVRREHWLPIVTRIHSAKGRGVRLLTLPGRHRLEVELYRRKSLLERREYDGVETLGVVGYETDPATFGMLAVERPRFELLENADLMEVLTDPGGELYARLTARFPFEVVNLDFTVPLSTPTDGPYSKALRSISSCLRLQAAQTQPWALFVTFRAMLKETSAETVSIWSDTIDSNLTNPQIKAAFYERFQITSASSFLQRDEQLALGEFAAKWIIDESHRNGWRVLDTRHVWYAREGGLYVITKLTFVLQRAKDVAYTLPTKLASEVGWHVDDLIKAIKGGRREDVSKRLATYERQKPEFVAELRREIQQLLTRPSLETAL